MSNFLDQWQKAESQGDWALLNHYLQQALLSNQFETLLSEIGIDRCLTLAIAILEAGDFRDRWDMAKLLPMLGEPAIPALVQLLQDEEVDLETRWFVARSLGELKSPATTHALIDLLYTSSDTELNLMAAAALAKTGKEAIVALISLLPNSNTRLPAVRALAQMDDFEIVEPLLQVIDDPDPEIRSLAIEALGRFPDPRILPVLLDGLNDPAISVKRAAIASVDIFPGAASTDLVERLGKCLYDLNLDVCRQAAIALGRLDNPEALTQLLRVFNSRLTPLPLQIECIRAIAWSGSAEALHGLAQRLTTSDAIDPHLCQEIVMALGRWHHSALRPDAAQLLLNLLASNHPVTQTPDLKQALALALGYLGQAVAIAPLTQLLADADPGVRLHTIAALKTLDAPAAHQYLEHLARQINLSEALQQGITIALQEWDR